MNTECTCQPCTCSPPCACGQACACSTQRASERQSDLRDIESVAAMSYLPHFTH